jgi:hypothetical protein
VLEAAGHHVGAAADQRLQRPRAAREIRDLDLDTVLAEIAEPLGDRERQVEQGGLAADREPNARELRLCVLAASGQRGGDERGESDCGLAKAFHGFLLYFVSLVAPEPCSASAQRAKPVMSLNVSKSRPSFSIASVPALSPASARSIVRATRKISEVG